ncbi:MAG: urease accessory protein UreE [Rikenellaceae bacterium]
MKITEILGNQSQVDLSGLEIDEVQLEWYELSKRIQRKKTAAGRDIAMKYMAESVAMKEGDVLFRDTDYAIVVRVLATPTIVISPANMYEMATICYEIGNKHMPLFIEGEEILLPYEAPMFRWLQSAGYNPKEESRKLVNRLKSNASGHHHSHDKPHHESLFEKVIGFAARNSE